jgi:hypothetical protein
MLYVVFWFLHRVYGVAVQSNFHAQSEGLVTDIDVWIDMLYTLARY